MDEGFVQVISKAASPFADSSSSSGPSLFLLPAKSNDLRIEKSNLQDVVLFLGIYFENDVLLQVVEDLQMYVSADSGGHYSLQVSFRPQDFVCRWDDYNFLSIYFAGNCHDSGKLERSLG